MVKISYTGEHRDQLEKLLLKHTNINETIDQRVVWFFKNPNDTRLNNHPLKRKLEGKWAFSITDDIRIVYEWMGKNQVRFLAIGPHRAIYR